MLQIVFPAFARTDEMLDLMGAARLPKLDMLRARARQESIRQASLEGMLCEQLGIAREHDWPIAAITLAGAGGQAGEDCWLRADPVHVRVERDQLVLEEIHGAELHEIELLRDALATHFGEAFSPQPLRPDAWVVRISGELEIATTPPSLAAGRHINPLLPAGPDALAWRKLLNEAQMLLFSHPVNQAREARGDPPINSVWLWGGGRLPEAGARKPLLLLSSQPDLRALARHAGAKADRLPQVYPADLPEDTVIILDAPHRHLRRGDFEAWLQAVQDFEQDWLAPLLASRRPFRLDDPLQGLRLNWRSAYRWKFWRSPQKTAQPGFTIRQPAPDAGVDAFGNRY